MQINSSTRVFVSGANGFLASELISQLLAKGCAINGTVRSMKDVGKYEHLWAIPGAKERLTIFEADLLGGKDGFLPALKDCQIVFHTACPFVVTSVAAGLGEAYFVKPAVAGTLAVLEAVKEVGAAKRVILTSSSAAIFKKNVPADHVYDERTWNDPVELATRKMWYSIAKTLQEQEAWKWMEETKPSFSMVSINPTMIAGGALQPALNASLQNVLDMFNGSSTFIKNFNMPWVHVRDVGEAHIAAAEKPEASGRYLMCGQRSSSSSSALSSPPHPLPAQDFDMASALRLLRGDRRAGHPRRLLPRLDRGGRGARASEPLRLVKG
jgi:nucleoside-diphosphate-sugar epimerase